MSRGTERRDNRRQQRTTDDGSRALEERPACDPVADDGGTRTLVEQVRVLQLLEREPYRAFVGHDVQLVGQQRREIRHGAPAVAVLPDDGSGRVQRVQLLPVLVVDDQLGSDGSGEHSVAAGTRAVVHGTTTLIGVPATLLTALRSVEIT